MGIYYSASAGGFFDSAIHKSIPDDAVSITNERRSELLAGQAQGKVIAPGDGGGPVLQDPPPPNPPRAVTMRQARLALLAAGLLDDVNDAIQSAGTEEQIEWEYAQTVERDSALVQAMSGALSLSDERLNELFEQAAAL